MLNQYGIDPVALDRYLTTPPDDDALDPTEEAQSVLYEASKNGQAAQALLEAAGYEWTGEEWIARKAK